MFLLQAPARATALAGVASAAAVGAGGKENLEATVTRIQSGVGLLQPLLQSMEHWEVGAQGNLTSVPASPAMCTSADPVTRSLSGVESLCT